MTQATEQPPAVRRGPHCEALEGFLGEWKAKGQSCGRSDPGPAAPRVFPDVFPPETLSRSAR